MAIRNINTLIDSDLTYLTSQFDYYALANLGQRYGVSGEGITTSTFEFGDLLENNNFNENFIGFIKYDGTAVSIGSMNPNNPSIKELVKTIQHTSNYIYTEDKITLDFVVNDCDKYTNSIILYNSVTNCYTVGLVGYSEDSQEFHDLSLLVFDNDTNELVEGVHIDEIQLIKDNVDDTENPYYAVYYGEDDNVSYVVSPKTFITLNHVFKEGGAYTVDTYINYSSTMYDESEYEAESEESNFHKFTMEELGTDFIDILKALGSNLDVTTFLSLSLITDNFIEYTSINLEYNTNNVYFSIPEEIDYTEEYSKSISYFNYDLTYILPFIKEYYSTHIYTLDNYTLKQQILVSFVKKLAEDADVTPAIGKEFYVYLPLDYSFSFFCKTSDQYYIYGSANNVAVSYVNVLNLADIHMPTCKTLEYNRCITYDFSVLYNEDDEDTIYDIIFIKKYIMPYINSNGYWVINDEETNVYARGLHAGQPNIIIVFTDKNNNSKVISSAQYEDIFTNREGEVWTARTIQMEPINKLNIRINTDGDEELSRKIIVNSETVIDSSNINVNSVYNVFNTNIIDYESYSDDIKGLLKDSILINITNVQNEIDNSTLTPFRDILGDEGVITTLWTLNEDTNQYECIMNPSNTLWAMDLHYMESLSNLVDWYLTNAEYTEPDNFYYDQLVFSTSYTLLKNQTLDDEELLLYSYIYPNIRTVDSRKDDYFLEDFVSYEYRNELNLLLEYNTTVEKFNDEIVSISQNDSRYLNINSEGKLNVGVTKYIGAYEYTPAYITPTIELKEVLVRNENNLSRLNIITPDKNSNMYYTYIGSSPFLEDKSMVHIGSSNTDFSFGTKTLAYQNNNFVKQTDIAIDFNTTYINGELYVDNNIYTNGVDWQITYYTPTNYSSPIKYNNLIYTAISEKYYFNVLENKANDEDYGLSEAELLSSAPEVLISKKHTIFAGSNHYRITLMNNILNKNYYKFNILNAIKINDTAQVYFLSVRQLINKLKLDTRLLANVTSNNEIYDITEINGHVIYDRLIKLSALSELEYNNVCISNPLSITHFYDQGAYSIHINELYTKNEEFVFPYTLDIYNGYNK